jgi:hypothetical protein
MPPYDGGYQFNPAFRHEPSVEKPNEYWGKSFKELQEFQRRCFIAFSLAPRTYNNDRKRILFAMQFMRGEVAITWERFEKENDPDSITWDQFNTHLRDILQDPVNRELDKIQEWMDAHHGKTQTVQQFVAYLERIESELRYQYTDQQQFAHLLAKLRPELRSQIKRFQTVPKTRAELITIAQRIEQEILPPSVAKKAYSKPEIREESSEPAAKKQKRTGSNRGGRRGPNRSPATGANASSTGDRSSKSGKPKLSQAERDRRRDGNLCYECGKPGHLASACYKRAEKKGESGKAPTQ